jgi:serine/threonine protein phosphatase PrpC
VLRCAIRTDVGRRRNNEDAVFCTPRLAALADGVGGASAGEIASSWAINHMASLDASRLTKSLDEELRDAVIAANQTLRFLVTCRPRFAGMGTTLTAVALSNEGNYLVVNVGDSRTYLLREDRLRQLTRDQSLVQALVDRGLITPEQAQDHPQRSVVLQALDGREALAPDLVSARACSGDRLLLCSDGLSDVVPDSQIVTLLSEPSRELAATRLVDAALDAGGQDNISVIVADVAPNDDPEAAWLDALPPPPRRLG